MLSPFAVAISDSSMAQIITSITSLFTLLITGLLAYVMARMKYNQEARGREVAIEVAEVKHVLETTTTSTDGKLDNLAIVAETSHTFMNEKMGAKLKKLASYARREADRTGEPGDVRDAEIAEQEYREHQEAQKKVDSGPGSERQKKGQDHSGSPARTSDPERATLENTAALVDNTAAIRSEPA